MKKQITKNNRKTEWSVYNLSFIQIIKEKREKTFFDRNTSIALTPAGLQAIK